MNRAKPVIRVRGACQNNLKNIDLDIPLGELIVVTGVSGSGKSSLAFDTVYAEGQRRYVETFSAYARQFLDRMDKPRVGLIDGVPPAIAIDQVNPVRTSRSTVGTMTELNDHLKLLFARAATLYCPDCNAPVRQDSAEQIGKRLLADRKLRGKRVIVSFEIKVPENFSEKEVEAMLRRQGYTRFVDRKGSVLEVIQDRMLVQEDQRERLSEALEGALRVGRGRLAIRLAGNENSPVQHYSSILQCPDCDRHFRDPMPGHFSFNSPAGACPQCKGFGRTMGIDPQRVIPDPALSLAQGAIKPWQSPSFAECQEDVMRHARHKGIPLDVPWRRLKRSWQRWIFEGDGSIDSGKWYGVWRFFNWLESKSYRMHIRVLLARYRTYHLCPDCQGARLVPESLFWKLTAGAKFTERAAGAVQHYDIHQLMLLPIGMLQQFFASLELPAPSDAACAGLLGEIRTRLAYLVEVGLEYLTLDRQSRTLSGGEVQRINLTTALGSSLVNALFVLDEPSVGLHDRDLQRLIGILRRLRDAGNSLLVVEHDEQMIRAADRVIDMGPGPAAQGGEIVAFTTPGRLLRHPTSVTATYLRQGVRGARQPQPFAVSTAPSLRLKGACEHNLKHLNVDFPLGKLVCVTGVSGSGKSTLVVTTLYRALRKSKGLATEPPGQFDKLNGAGEISEVVLVDQSAIGKSSRSNPASYVGAMTPIRKLFARQPLAVEYGFGPGSFSFNSGDGRCPGCSGSGFEHVEMQFLSDVYLRCPDCDGRRYRDEILAVQLFPDAGHSARACSIADVLQMSVVEAVDYFHKHSDIQHALHPLLEVGLGYLQLGQPVPTLSGGEAQRLKLAGRLAQSKGVYAGSVKNKTGRRQTAKGALLIFDEPTTGLHLADVEILLAALRKLIEAGHSVLVIEHHLDVIGASDWVIDLGPQGGAKGGQVQFQGTPLALAGSGSGYSAESLAAHVHKRPARAGESTTGRRRKSRTRGKIEIQHAREHNLKNVSTTIPLDEFTVITGVSGSGKSTLAFDILFAEGQRRYLESLNAYARQFVQPANRAEVDVVSGIPPTVAIEQRISRGGRKSTVGTLTEIHHFLRLLFVKAGERYCPECNRPISAQSAEKIFAEVLRYHKGKSISVLAPLIVARKGYYTELARWANNKNYTILQVDGRETATANWPRLDRFREHDIDLPVATLKISSHTQSELRAVIARALELGKGVLKVVIGNDLRTCKIYSTTNACVHCGLSFPALDPRLFSYNSRHGWCLDCFGTGRQLDKFTSDQSGEESAWLEMSDTETQCGACAGQRLNPQALAVRYHGRTIADYSAMSAAQAAQCFAKIKSVGREKMITADILAELNSRLSFLNKVGLDYLSLDRAAPDLSGGEAQRIRLAAQLGSNLRGVCYILDEPSIGLHSRDNRRLLDILRELGQRGNTVVVVEHDEETIRAAGHLIDLGPGAGAQGGEIVASGSLKSIQASPRSITGQFLNRPALPRHNADSAISRINKQQCIEMRRVHRHNLKLATVRIPLHALVCVTGVSGSGKSTLIRQVLRNSVHQQLQRKHTSRKQKSAALGNYGCESVTGADSLQQVLEVNQSPIGKTPRSCPATYVGFFDSIRQLFAQTPEAGMRGYPASRFSFNVAGGRCDACAGQGYQRIEMSFLPDVQVRCEECAGSRYGLGTREVKYRGKSIADILAMSIDNAVDFFAAQAKIHHALKLLQDVGLGYLRLGQPSPTLSGGEAQRLKLVTELAKYRQDPTRHIRPGKLPHTLYILDEPSIGLHMADVERLCGVLQRLVAAGNTVIVIEHNLDLIAATDWIIDLGPEGGDRGGRLVAQGPPAKVAAAAQRKGRRYPSYTAIALQEFLGAPVRGG